MLVLTLVSTLVVAGSRPAGAITDDVAVYVSSTHEVLLGQVPSPEAVDRWAPVVVRDRPMFTAALTASPGWARWQVERLYRQHLQRAPEPVAADHWSALIERGGEPSEVEAHVVASAEHRSRHRATDDGAFIDLLYRSLLGREADADGRSHWMGHVRTGLPPVDIAGHLLASPEGMRRQVDELYRHVLARPAATAEQATWAPHLAGAGQREVEAALAASEERYTRATGTRPVVAATTNLAGWQMHAGDLAPAQTVADLVTRARPRPAVIGLAEVCASGDAGAPGQREHLTSALAPLGYSVVWAPSIEAFGRPGCEQFGNLLAVRGTVIATESVRFDAQRVSSSRDYQELRNAVCADAVVGGRTLVGCTTHLVNPSPTDIETTRRQAAEALAFVTSVAPDAMRLVVGDLNLVPTDPALDGWFAELRWADPAGRTAAAAPTTDGGATVDYAFASPAGTSSVTGLDVVVLPTSDHHWVPGTFRLLP